MSKKGSCKPPQTRTALICAACPPSRRVASGPTKTISGREPEPERNNASYIATTTPAASGTVTVDIAAGAAQDGAGNPSAAAMQFSIVADLTPVPALPVIGAIALALLLLGGGARRRTAS